MCYLAVLNVIRSSEPTYSVYKDTNTNSRTMFLTRSCGKWCFVCTFNITVLRGHTTECALFRSSQRHEKHWATPLFRSRKRIQGRWSSQGHVECDFCVHVQSNCSLQSQATEGAMFRRTRWLCLQGHEHQYWCPSQGHVESDVLHANSIEYFSAIINIPTQSWRVILKFSMSPQIINLLTRFPRSRTPIQGRLSSQAYVKSDSLYQHLIACFSAVTSILTEDGYSMSFSLSTAYKVSEVTEANWKLILITRLCEGNPSFQGHSKY